MRAAFAAIALVLFAYSGEPCAADADLQIVLAADVSRSIDDGEFDLQRKGYAAALTDPRVLTAIQGRANGALGVCFVEWSGEEEQHVVVDWTEIRDEEDAASVAAAILAAPRSFMGRTSISAAIDFSMKHFQASGVESDRRVIDVSGDGTNNAGRLITDARDAAAADGVTINGLAIINERADGVYARYHVAPPEGLPEYFRQNVIGGPGAFLLEVQGFASFSEAITKKLVNEISALPPPTRFASSRPTLD